MNSSTERKLTEQRMDAATTAAAADRQPISAFVITYNEEDDIGACLDSLSFCDEIVVIDSYSQDATVEICETKGARVIQRPWPGYREQKAFGLSQVSHRWVINLDADERVDAELRESVIEILRRDYQAVQRGLEGDPEIADGYEVNRVVFYLGKWWRRGGWYPEYRVRLFRRSKVVWGGQDPHEKPIVSGSIGRLKGELQHYTYRNLGEQFERLHRYASISAKHEFDSGGRFSIRQLLLNPILRTVKFYVLKRGFREGLPGLIVAIAEGYYTYIKYAKLWELERGVSGGAESRPAK